MRNSTQRKDRSSCSIFSLVPVSTANAWLELFRKRCIEMGLETVDPSERIQSEPSSDSSATHSHIREVWAFNLEEEMDTIRDIAESYPYIAMVCIVCMHARDRHVGYGIPRRCCPSSRAFQRWPRL